MSKQIKKSILFLLTACILCGTINVFAEESQIERLFDLPYGDGVGPAHLYDLYIPNTAYYQNNVPLILYIHGGGFNEGDKSDEDNEMFWEPYLDRGYVVANVNYTLVNEDNPGHGIAEINEEIYMAVKDIALKLEDLQINCTQMATLGYSAGGCLAMMYAYTHPSDPIPVKFVAQGSGPADFSPDIWEGSGRGSREEMVLWASGNKVDASDISEEQLQEIADEISPAYYVNSKTVPTCMLYGEMDMLVPPAAKNRLIENLKQSGVKYDYISCPFAGHLVVLVKPYYQAWVNKALEYCDWYFVKPTGEEKQKPNKRSVNDMQDVPVDAWFFEPVNYVMEQGIMGGVSETSFAPNDTMTRAMVAQMLYAMEGYPAIQDEKTTFRDVFSNAWYYEAVQWAGSEQIFGGYEDGCFYPDQSITREQMATVLKQYRNRSTGEEPASGELHKFADESDVDEWARPGLAWAVHEGLMVGKDDGKIYPKDYATRAEVAQIMENYTLLEK